MSSTGSTTIQIKRSIKLQFTISAFVLLIVALGFNALLSLNSLEKLYVESIASQYSAIGKDLQRNLEKSLRFGKSLKTFIGIDKMLEETKSNLIREYSQDTTASVAIKTVPASDISVSVALPDGSILYSTDEKFVGTTLPEQVRIDYETSEDESHPSHESNYVKYVNMYYTSLPVHDMKKKWVATAIIAFDEKQVKALLDTVRDNSIKMILIILVGSIVLLIILLNLAIPHENNFQKLSRLRMALVILLVIGSAQIVFSGLNTNTFGKYYLQINKQKARTLTTLLKEDIEFLFSKGIRINKLVKMDVEMREIIDASPELRDITISDNNGIPLYMAAKEDMIDFQKATDEQLELAYSLMGVVDSEYNIHLDLLKDDEEKEGAISTNLSKDVIFAKLFEIALDSTTILVISFLFFGELLILIFQFIERQVTSTNTAQTTSVVHYSSIRPIAFLFFFGIDICISFLPLHMETLYEPIFGLSKNIVMGLPISMQMLFTGISLLLAGPWLDRRGWHEPFFIGLLLSAGGFYYAWSAPNAIYFIVSLGLVGLGYGFSYMASQGFVIASTTEATKAQGLAQLYAGCLAGSICGGAAGAMLAERIGYAPVFLVGSGILLFVVMFTIIFMRSAIRKPQRRDTRKSKQSVKIGRIVRFLSSRSVLGVILLSSVPASIAVVGFLNYFSPVYLKQIGTSQSNIGRILMIYGLCIIYIAPFVSKKVGGSKTPQRYIFLSGLLASLAFISFQFLGGIAAAVAISILLLGLAGSFNACRNSYVVNLKVSQKLGEGTAMGILFSVARLGQVAGPLVFGWLVAIGINKGITSFGVVYLAVTVLFLLSAQGRKKRSITENLPS
jgi:predicted MFS family arabinose efflux permease